MIAEQVDLIQSGGKVDFHYGGYSEFAFDPVTVDQVFQDGDVIRLCDVALPPRLTRAHTKRSTFIMNGSEKCSLSFAREWCRVRWIDAAAPPR
jgi:hypothetical protein